MTQLSITEGAGRRFAIELDDQPVLCLDLAGANVLARLLTTAVEGSIARPCCPRHGTYHESCEEADA